MSDRLFTLEEANRLLPEIAPVVERLRDAQRSMEEHHADVVQSMPGNGGGNAGTAFLEATQDAAQAATLLEEMGIIVRDPATGLIDFPAERDGARVYLCWRLGEERIAWWHPPDTGVAGREPL